MAAVEPHVGDGGSYHAYSTRICPGVGELVARMSWCMPVCWQE